MSESTETEEVQWPSIDDHHPREEGGPTARSGLSYQDEIVVGIFLDMISDVSIKRVHCETHDDIVIVKSGVENAIDIVEYVQVKSNEPDSLWSVAALCAKGEESVCAKSLGRDQHQEAARFRIVTLRDVHSDLKPLTYPCYGPGRETDCDQFVALSAEIKSKLPGLQSAKGNSTDYWLEHCQWEVRHDEKTIRDGNIVRILRLAAAHGVLLLPEHAEAIE
jgi:Cap4 dsDNA endonuclease